MKVISECGVCGSTEFHLLMDLPLLPLTERFGNYAPENCPPQDQQLIISGDIGHVQLRNQLDTAILYSTNEYAFRTGDSAKSRSGVSCFTNWLEPLLAGRHFRSLVDVGGNDGYLARMLRHRSESLSVIDPIYNGEDGSVEDGVRFFGRFMEQMNLSRDLPLPDLIICRHTLEHVARPAAMIRQWFDQCTEDCLFAIEVPSLSCLVEGLRFDAIFHQHFHYYDLDSFRYLIWACGGEYLAHHINQQGSCGGALMVLFRKAKTRQERPRIDLPARIKLMETSIRRHKAQMQLLAETLAELEGPVYGYGAGLMLATYAYHLKNDLSGLVAVLDDDPAKHGGGYQNLPVRIQDPRQSPPPHDASYLITSLENMRPIHKRIQDFKPRRILMPLIS